MLQTTRKHRVLFLCTGNACRSQMAEGWARHLAADVIEAHSAGTAPKPLDPRAVAAMAEVGVDIAAQRSKHVDRLSWIEFDAVVTVCDAAREACPVFPGGAKVAHVPFDDPPRLAAEEGPDADEAKIMRHYRRVRDEIRVFVEGLALALREKTAADTPGPSA